jgi:dolichol-phosphate mannosyltransferase
VGLALGLLFFYAICSVGMLANVGIARFLYSEQPLWWFAGLPGAIVGVVVEFYNISRLRMESPVVFFDQGSITLPLEDA